MPLLRTIDYLKRLLFLGVCLVVALPALASARGPAAPPGPLVEVVVELREPSLARAGRPVEVAVQQRVTEERIRAISPSARFRWRYRITLNGLAVVVPERDVSRLEQLPGVREVYRSVRFAAALDRSVPAIRAPEVWGPALATSGQGIKIGIIDDGIDQTHPFFSPSGYTMPAGYPKGTLAYTTAKVIAARAFPPASPKPPFGTLPFHPTQSEHGTHVAGIAAGNPGTSANVGGGQVKLAGVAPRAYLGNYRVMTVPTSDVGLNGNSPEIAAGVEAAVKDGMDVINLSLGEPEISPGRDLVVRAIEGAAAAGVVPAIAAGNDYALFGKGSISSPGSARSAITAAASTPEARLAGFSSSGPTPITLQMKPDVTAPGVQILSSVPAREGTWAGFSGTSMAAPHVAGAAALLTQRHPTWTVAQVKSALVLTSRPAFDGAGEALTTRQGAGFIDVFKADQPLLFTQPTSVSFGQVRRGSDSKTAIAVTDAGGGAGEWTASVARQSNGSGVSFSLPPRLVVPGALSLAATVTRSAREGDATGFVVLSRGAETRRLPFWLRVTAPRLARQPARLLSRTGTYRGNTRGRRALVSSYRYPENPGGIGVARTLKGPEQVFRVRIRRPVANFGVAITSRTRVQPRTVQGKDENRQAGSPALPLRVNPYLSSLFTPAPISGVIRPANGTYHVVFDSPTRADAGRFTFRFWIDDRTPPRLRIATPTVRRGPLVVAAVDRGAGVDPGSLIVQVDGRSVEGATFRGGRIRIPVGSIGTGRHSLTLQVSDYQEAKNMENVPQILPNTAVLRGNFRVR